MRARWSDDLSWAVTELVWIATHDMVLVQINGSATQMLRNRGCWESKGMRCVGEKFGVVEEVLEDQAGA